MSCKALLDKRLELIAQSRALLDKATNEGRDLSAEEEANWQALNKEIDRTKDSIDKIAKLDQAEAEVRNYQDALERFRRDIPASAVPSASADEGPLGDMPFAESRALAVQAYFIRQSRDPKAQSLLTDKHRAALERHPETVNRDPETGALTLNLSLPGKGEGVQGYNRVRGHLLRNMRWDASNGAYYNVNPLTPQVGAGGGVLIPEGFINRFETALLAYGYMLQVAEVMRTTGANPMPWPTANDTSNKGRRLNVNAAVDNTGANISYPTFGATVFYAYKYTSDEILVPFELLRDNAVGLEAWLGEALGVRIGRVINDDFTTGTGADQPKGIITASVSGKTAASATAIKWDDLLDLEQSVDFAYRTQPGVGYMAHDAIVYYLRKLKNGDGNPLWQPSLQGGEPDRINGFPFTRNQSMDSTVASGKKTVLFGLLNKYKIRQVGDLRLYRLVERYRDNDQDAFLAFQEFDGNLLDAGTHPVKYLTH